jgi:hypothetical protein
MVIFRPQLAAQPPMSPRGYFSGLQAFAAIYSGTRGSGWLVGLTGN